MWPLQPPRKRLYWTYPTRPFSSYPPPIQLYFFPNPTNPSRFGSYSPIWYVLWLHWDQVFNYIPVRYIWIKIILAQHWSKSMAKRRKPIDETYTNKETTSKRVRHPMYGIDTQRLHLRTLEQKTTRKQGQGKWEAYNGIPSSFDTFLVQFLSSRLI